ISESREDFSGANHPMYGRKHSEEARRKMKENRPDFSGEKNPMYGRSGENSPNWGKGKAIILIFPDGSKKEFSSITEASLWLGGSQRNYSTKTGIQKLLKGWTPKKGRWV